MKYDPFLYGKNQTEGVVGVEYVDGKLIIFTEDVKSGDVTSFKIDHEVYCLYDHNNHVDCQLLGGNLKYKYARKFKSEAVLRYESSVARYQGYDCWKPRNSVEGALLSKGITFFKGIEPKDISVLAFDIETTTIDPEAKGASVLSIATAHRSGGKIETKLFAYDDYANESLMVLDFCDYIRKMNPSIITGYNILGFDLPYLRGRGHLMRLGRNRSLIRFDERTSEKRKDASQSYSFKKAHIYGRQTIDLLHVTIDHDLANIRKLSSYKLKSVMKELKLERDNRAHYDASLIRDKYTDKEEWEKIKAYNIDDAVDVISLMDKIWEPFFYSARNIPMTFEEMTQTSSGTKINNFLVRAYLQDGHSLPKGSEKESYQGGVSFGNPGVYSDVYKVDVKSMYPSIIITERIFDKEKDPLEYFLRMMESFTKERLANKDMFENTGLQKYESLQGAQKIFINSGYGTLGAPKLNFNSPTNADLVTAKGREILKTGIEYAENLGLKIVNADTDSFSFTGAKLDDFSKWIEGLNSVFKKGIVWSNDGYYPRALIVKAKNYVLVKPDGTWVVKGNSLKATMKEPALKQMLLDFIAALLEGRENELVNIYNRYVIMASTISSVSDMGNWASRKTVTKAILSPSGTTQERIKDSLDGTDYAEADKINVFFETDEKVTLLENFNGTYEKSRLYVKIHSTIKTFESVIDLKLFTNYKLKRSKAQLDKLLASASNQSRVD